MLNASRLRSTDSLTVIPASNSAAVVGALQDAFAGAGLLLTYGPTNDEQALARDIHKAAGSDSAAWQQVQQMQVYNMFEACKRLKLAHASKIAATNAAEPDKRCNLDAMHKHFVTSSGRRFVSPTPERKSVTGVSQLPTQLCTLLSCDAWELLSH